MKMIKVWDLEGKEINLTKYGMEGLSLLPESPSYTNYTERIPGADGVISLGRDLNPRLITARFLVRSFDYTDSLIKRDDIYNLLSGKEPFYIGESALPYKRWFVESVDPWTPERFNPWTLVATLNLIAIKGYSESIGTTLQAETFEHLDLSVTYTDYTQHDAKFKIYNAGKPIDPRNINHFLRITYKGTSENIRIRNLTTGDEWAYNGTTSKDDEIVLEGIRASINGLSIFRQTNKQIITLDSGWNEFEIEGAPDAIQYAIHVNMPPEPLSDPIANPISFEFNYLF